MMFSHLSRNRRLSAAVATLGAVAAIAAAGTTSASANDTYVDHTDGSDTSAQCKVANPCATIGRGLQKAGRGDTVFVGGDPVAFSTPVKLRAGKSLVHRDFSTDPAVDTSGLARIDSGMDPRPAITVASKAGTIKDLYVWTASTPLEIHASVRVVQTKFPEAALMEGPAIDIAPDASGKVIIRKNHIQGPMPLPAGTQVGIRNRSRTAPLIDDNILSGLTTAISTKGRPTIRDNKIYGTHTGGTSSGQGIVVNGGTAILSRNQLYAPNTSGSAVTGILVQEADVELSGNRVLDYDTGIQLKNTPHPVKLTGDVIRTIAGSGDGLVAVDDTDSPGVSDPVVSNLTIVGPAQAVTLDSVRLRMDSSIIGDTQGSFMSLSGGPTCRITNSRAPFAGTAADGCAFPMKTDPLFAPDGYHLTAASPMIDEGSKRAPRPGARDIDGDPRALDGPDGGDCNGGSRRDIGADEYAC